MLRDLEFSVIGLCDACIQGCEQDLHVAIPAQLSEAPAGHPAQRRLSIIPTLYVSRVAGDRAIEIVDRIVVRSVRYSAP